MQRDVKLGALRIDFWTGWRALLSIGLDGWIGRTYLSLAILLPGVNITLTLNLNND
jgi:hypothetical protein